ncbi:MAG TPA: ATP-dependent Clp protease proteolytic subunit, partial [Telluria sp.]|nr:ATP-dependent Clp protease proteolytic subunit [Telluria sp.]
MSLHIVHFIGPINHNTACTIRNLCLQAVQSGASSIELHLSSEGGNMTAGFALYFFLKSLPIPLITHNVGSIESIAVVIFLAGQKRYACPGTRFLVHPLNWGFGNLVAADHARVTEWRECLDFDA